MTPSKTHERRGHYRGISRPGQRIDLRYRVAGSAAQLQDALTRNIGPGGAFIACAEQPDVGTVLELHMKLPGTAETILLTGEVRWFLEGDRATRGVGLRFVDIDTQARLALNNYFAALLGGSVR